MKTIRVVVTGLVPNESERGKVFEFNVDEARNRCVVPDSKGKVELLNHILSDFLNNIEIEMLSLMKDMAKGPVVLKQKGVISKI